MHDRLIPVLLLVALPALYFGARLGWLERRRTRWLLGGALALAAVLALPWGGVDFLYVKRVNLLLAAAAALLLLLRRHRVPWTLERARFDAALAVLAALAGVNYVHYFSFHGERTFVHLHDVAHYYLGSKYYGELGYTDLYTAMLRAEAVMLFEDREALLYVYRGLLLAFLYLALWLDAMRRER